MLLTSVLVSSEMAIAAESLVMVKQYKNLLYRALDIVRLFENVDEVDWEAFVSGLGHKAFATNCQLDEGLGLYLLDEDVFAIEALASICEGMHLDAMVVFLHLTARGKDTWVCTQKALGHLLVGKLDLRRVLVFDVCFAMHLIF